MRGWVVAISMEKVQTFLYEVINSQVQQKQTEAHTLRQILNASFEISNELEENVNKHFPEDHVAREEILRCSGFYAFSCDMDEAALQKELNDLFLEYYNRFQGQALLRYAYFPSNGMDELAAVQKAKSNLKKSACMNAIIKKNADTLFRFQPIDREIVLPRQDINIGCEEEYPYFTGKTDDLAPWDKSEQQAKSEVEPEKVTKNSARFRIAVIKADLDGMGDMFKDLNDFEKYKRVSEVLNEYISMKGFHAVVREYAQEQGMSHYGLQKLKILPLYFAGDDLFFLTPIAHFVTGVTLCQRLMDKINHELEGIAKLKLRIGVDFTLNAEPIRYYYERVNDQMELGRLKNCEEFDSALQSRISICGCTYYDIQKESLSSTGKEATKSEPIWGYLLHAVKVLNYIKKDEYRELLGMPNYFYGLLDKITDQKTQSSKVKLSNALFYHLIPRYIGSAQKGLMEQELQLKYSIAKQLYVKKNGSFALSFDANTMVRLKAFIRLMLLLSDGRFSIRMEQDIDANVFDLTDQKNLNDIKKKLFRKVLEYYYHNNLTGAFRSSFVYDLRSRPMEVALYYPIKERLHTAFYLKLSIHKSAFIKMLIAVSDPADWELKARRVSKMLASTNPSGKNEMLEINKKRLGEGKKYPSHRLFFDEDVFYTKIKDLHLETDYVTSLLIFYQYEELLTQLSVATKSYEGGTPNA